MVRIVVDSTCDIPKETRENYGLTMVPLTILFEDGAYRDGIDLTPEEFYLKLSQSAKLPSTAQVNPGEFEEVFKSIIAEGDDIVCICIAAELSGTIKSAEMAAKAVAPGRIHCVDSRTGTIGAHLVIKEAVELRNKGLSARELAEKARAIAERVRIFAMVDTLKYLRMGGRLSGTTAILGELLDIHPIIQASNGAMRLIGKVRGHKAAIRKLLDIFLSEPADFSHGVIFGHSNAPELLNKLMDCMKPHIKTKKIVTGILGSVIGAHVGPGAIGFAYVTEARA